MESSCFDAMTKARILIVEDQAIVARMTALRLQAVEKRLIQFSRAVEQSPASIVITDPDGCIEYVNPRFTEVTGFAAAEAIGQNPRVLKSGIHPAEYYRDLWATIATGREWQGEFCNRRKGGELYWELASISPVRDDAGRITHFVAVKEDITARKHGEDTLRESEARYRTLVDNVGEGIGVVDLQERFIFANPAAENIFGVPAGRLVGLNLREFTAPGQFEMIAEQTRRRQAGATGSYEIEISRPDGGKRTLLVTAVPPRDREGQFNSTFGVFRDITERKQAEERSIWPSSIRRRFAIARARWCAGFLPAHPGTSFLWRGSTTLIRHRGRRPPPPAQRFRIRLNSANSAARSPACSPRPHRPWRPEANRFARPNSASGCRCGYWPPTTSAQTARCCAG